MKFGKEYKRQMVPEWVDAYMDYNGLKKILREIRLSRLPKTPQTPLRAIQSRLSMYSPFRGAEVGSRNRQNEGDLENQVIKVSPFVGERNRTFYRTRLLLPPEEIGGEDEVKFFRKLDEELNKVNAFYREKVDEVVKEATELNKQMDAYIALRIKVRNPGFKRSDSEVAMEALRVSTPSREAPSSENSGGGRETANRMKNKSDLLKVLDHVKINNTLEGPISAIRGIMKDPKDKGLSFSKRELKEVEEQLKVVFTEFYQKLRLLKNYSFMNLSAFAKILKKYDKTTSRYASQSYMKIVDKSYLGSSDEVTKLMENVEHLFVKNFFDANRREGMKPLRLRPKREKHRVTFLSGFFSGCSIALVIAIILMVRARRIMEKGEGSLYMDNMFGLYSLFLYIVLHMLMYAADIYFWKRYRINYPFIFNFKQGTELGFRDVFLLSTGLAVLTLASFLANFNMIIGLKLGESMSFAKLIPLLLVLVFITILFCPCNIIYRSSRCFFIKCLFRCIFAPFYEVTLPDFFLADQLTSQISAIRSIEFYACYYSQRGFPQGQSKCHDYGVYNAFYFVIAVVPYWIRFLQCIRRLVQERDLMHGYNALKYLMAVVAVVIRTAYELKKGKTWLVMALISSAMAVLYNTYWDIVVDWGLLRRSSKNFYLRNKIVVSHKSVYYIAMVINVLLRAAWLQLVLEFSIKGLRKTAFSTTISCLEIVRRGIWNFFRLENEHLNNVGKFRAFKSVPLPFSYHDHNDDDEDEEKDD